MFHVEQNLGPDLAERVAFHVEPSAETIRMFHGEHP
jgi:hypothetical protein